MTGDQKLLAAFLAGILIGTAIGWWQAWNMLSAERDKLQALLDHSDRILQTFLAKTGSTDDSTEE